MTDNKKSAFTVVLGCQADSQKLPPMVIFNNNKCIFIAVFSEMNQIKGAFTKYKINKKSKT